LARISVRC